MNKNYKHKTTGQSCNAAQYIAEMVCMREAEKQNIGRPAHALWNTQKWQKKYQSQVTKAYQFLKKYEDKAIINALNSYQGKFIYSLRVKTLEKLIQKEQGKLDKIDLKGSPCEDHTQSRPSKPYGKKSFIRKLDG